LIGVVSYYLIRSVRKEIELRAQLEIANKRQQETLRFITHEVKGYLTDGAAALDAILSQVFGPITADMKEMVSEAMTKNRNAVREIQNFLRIADFKTGKVAYQIKPFDFKTELEKALVASEETAKNKGLTFVKDIAPGDYTMSGDADQLLNHVIGNLVNNAINYTPQGTVTVQAQRKSSSILFSVKDSGVGLTPEDKALLFTEGGHGKDSRVTNPHSTGYGLFIAKKIVDAHQGRIWAESEGRGLGSTFFVELPINGKAFPAAK
jgi:signal transduction histidine kinase